MKSLFSKLAWPWAYRVHELSEILDEESLVALIIHFADKSPKERAFLFPRRQVIRKVLAHHYGTLVEQKKMSWDQVMKVLKGQFETLREVGITRKEVRRLYEQRCREKKRERQQ